MAETVETTVPSITEEAPAPKRKLWKKIAIGVAATTAVVGGVALLASRKGTTASDLVEEIIPE